MLGNQARGNKIATILDFSAVLYFLATANDTLGEIVVGNNKLLSRNKRDTSRKCVHLFLLHCFNTHMQNTAICTAVKITQTRPCYI